MRYIVLLIAMITSVTLHSQERQEGFFSFTWHEDNGKITVEVPSNMIGQQFLYVNSLSAGIGSNDIGLDRGQLGNERIVKFEKIGNKLLLIQPNMDYRAVSDNALERRAVEEAFAQSVLWGFEIQEGGDATTHHIDLTPMLMNDAHGVTQRLKRSKQGSYKLDKSRSGVWMQRTKAFPDNTEFDALLTFAGQAEGGWIRSVAPSSDAVTVRQHHSFIRLPDDNYEPRVFHPFSGFNMTSYADYATAIEEPMVKRFINRHRLEKKNPDAAVSEAVEPIIYYMDPGCPDPIKSALIEGGSWWDQAFQSAGFAPGTFQVRELPQGADMMDVRYNVIQWVHRSTRGWSYGASVVDPRTGEILKGHVSLGSLRVRQDFLIAQGILSPFASSDDNTEVMKDMALARLRQLSAHEIGHTIGLSHNFAASAKNRASVMDYPHPYIELNLDGNINFASAYDDKIGAWDKITIQYGYSDFPDGQDEAAGLQKIITDAQQAGYQFISDRDARPLGGAHPVAHLWDSGVDPVTELDRLMRLRKNGLRRFGENSITTGTPLSELEKVLVPLYLMHRYQMEGAAKLIGGLQYNYAVKGDAQDHQVQPVSLADQDKAMRSIINSLLASELALPQHILELIPPPAHGYSRDRETFESRSNLAFDGLAPAESYAHMVLGTLLHADRLARIHRHNVVHGHGLSLSQYLEGISNALIQQRSVEPYHEAIEDMVRYIMVKHMISATHSDRADPAVVAAARDRLQTIGDSKLSDTTSDDYLKHLIETGLDDPSEIILPDVNDMPPGSPIGCGHNGHM